MQNDAAGTVTTATLHALLSPEQHHQQNHLHNSQMLQQPQFMSSGHVHLPPNTTAICLQQQQQKQSHKQTITAHIATNNIVKMNADIEQQQQHQLQQQQQQQIIGCQASQSLFNHSAITNNLDCDFKNCQLSANSNSVGVGMSGGSHIHTNSSSSRRIQCGPVSSARALETHNLLQRYVTGADVEFTHGFHSLSSSGGFLDTSTGGCGAGGGGGGVGGSYNDFELIASPTQFANNSTNPIAHLPSSVSTPTLDALPPPPSLINSGGIATISASTSDSVTQTMLTGIGSGHHTLPTHHTQASKGCSKESSAGAVIGGTLNSRTSSSARKFHRTIPRYLAVGSDSLTDGTTKERQNSQSAKAASDTKSSASGSSSQSNARKLTCQCPVQHVPMSYMGNQILTSGSGGSAASSPVFISVLGNKLSGTSSASSTTSSSTQSSMRSSMATSATSSRSRLLGTCDDAQLLTSSCISKVDAAKRSTQPNRDSASSSPSIYNKSDSKIATISKQVADVSLESGAVGMAPHHHQNNYHAPTHSKHQHNTQNLSASPGRNEEFEPIVLGRVHKKSNADRHRSSSGGSSRGEGESITNSQASSGSYLDDKTDSCYYDEQHADELQYQKNDTLNPLLPPKLHKSLTNLKTTSNLALIPRRTNATPNASSPTPGNQVTTVKTSSTKHHNTEKQTSSHKKVVSSATTAVQTSHTQGKALKATSTLSTTSKLTASSTASRKDYLDSKNTPPSLTLTLPPTEKRSAGNTSVGIAYAEATANSATSLEKTSSKINSTTFYPSLQNNHATYTLPKHITGKVSLNSTIASVVSKVPSVISIPVNSSSNDSTNNNFTTNKLNEANQQQHQAHSQTSSVNSSNGNPWKCTTLPKSLRTSKQASHRIGTASHVNTKTALHSRSLATSSRAAAAVSCAAASSSSSYPYQFSPSAITTSLSKSLTTSAASATLGKHLPVCTTSKNCFNPREHFLPNDTSLDDDYLSECENCKTAHSAKYYLNVEEGEALPQETMTLQRKLIDDAKDEQDSTYYRISHTLPTNSKKIPIKNNNREPTWFSTIPASSSSDEDANQ